MLVTILSPQQLAGRLLGLSQATATRELDRLVNIIPIKTNELIGEIETHRDTHLAASSNPDAVRAFMAGETRMLDAVRHIVIAEVARRLRADQ